MNFSFTLKSISPNNICHDESYQRTINSRYVKIADQYDPLLFTPIRISKREDGTLWVVDGAHRVQAARRLRLDTIPAMIYEGLTVEEEKYMFANQDKGEVRVSVLDKFRAGKNMKTRNEYVILNEILEEYRPHGLTEQPSKDGLYVRALHDLLKLAAENEVGIIRKVFDIYIGADENAKKDKGFWNARVCKAFIGALQKATKTQSILDMIKNKGLEELSKLSIEGDRISSSKMASILASA